MISHFHSIFLIAIFTLKCSSQVYLAKANLDSLRHKQAVLTVSRVSSFGDVYYSKSCEDMIVKGKVFLKLKYELATRKGNSIFFFPTKDSLVRLY